MNPTIESILILIAIILPGGLSRIVMRRYHPSVDYRSNLLEWSTIIYHATIVHIIGIWYVVVALWISMMIEERSFVIPIILPRDLFESLFNSHVIVTLSWLLILMSVSVLSGIYDLPSKITHLIARIVRRGEQNPKPLLDQSIWFKALDQDREAKHKEYVLVRIRMKNGDEYTGPLQHFPIVPDSNSEKDITLAGTVRFTSKDSSEDEIYEFGDEGGVLLNTGNISSLEYVYDDMEPASEDSG